MFEGDVRRAQMLPVLGRVVEGEPRVAILDQALDRLIVLDPQVWTKALKAASAYFLVSAIQIFSGDRQSIHLPKDSRRNSYCYNSRNSSCHVTESGSFQPFSHLGIA
jgi:hypothetical protein